MEASSSCAESETPPFAPSVPPPAVVYRVALTGGPSAGKTAALPALRAALAGAGFTAAVAPEALDVCARAGALVAAPPAAPLPLPPPADLVEWEAGLLALVEGLEDSLARMAAARHHQQQASASALALACESDAPNDPHRAAAGAVVLLCDRGVFDVLAFCTTLGDGGGALWDAAVARAHSCAVGHPTARRRLALRRYDAVLHFVSPACDPAHAAHFTCENNPHREADLAKAACFDDACWDAYVRRTAHAPVCRIAATADANAKTRAAACALLDALGPAAVLPVRVVVTAESFGFGPAAAAAHLFPFLRPRVQYLAYAGAGHTLDLHRRLAYDEVVDISADSHARLRELFAGFDAVVSCCDFPAVELAQSAGVLAILYDPLVWYWDVLPRAALRADLWVCQDFFGVRERVGVLPNVVIVPSLASAAAGAGAPRTRDLVLLNFGGLQNPLLSLDDLETYAAVVAREVLLVFGGNGEGGNAVRMIGSTALCERLRRRGFACETVQPDAAQALLARSRLAVCTPGLGNIFDASLLTQHVFWLPPANDSQGRQLRIIRAHGMAPFCADWHELLGGGAQPLDYGAEQESVMAALRDAIRAAATDAGAFARRLRERLVVADEQVRADGVPSSSSSPLAPLIEAFGAEGGRVAALHIIRALSRSKKMTARAGTEETTLSAAATATV